MSITKICHPGGDSTQESRDPRLSGDIGAHINRKGERIGRKVSVGRRQLQVMLMRRFRTGDFVVGLVSVSIGAEG